jgi:acyl carrier protein
MKRYAEEVIKAVGHVMDFKDTEAIKIETRLEEDLGFDSGHFIELIMQLEDQIPGLTIDPALLDHQDFLSVGTVATFISRRMESSGAI